MAVKGGLLGREIGFFDALRAAGVPVALSELLDATRAMGVVDLLDREALRQAFAATAVKRPNHRATYDRLFDLWWPAVTGEPTRGAAAEPGAAGDDDAPDTDALRDALRDLLLNVSIISLVVVGQTVVLLMKHVDLSVGSVVGLSAFLTGSLFIAMPGLPVPLAMAASRAAASGASEKVGCAVNTAA